MSGSIRSSSRLWQRSSRSSGARIHGEERPSDLDGHDGVIFVSQEGPRPWIFASRAGQISYQATASFRSNDGEQLRAAVLAGLGVTQAPHWLFAADIRAGTVRRILRDQTSSSHCRDETPPCGEKYSAGARFPTRITPRQINIVRLRALHSLLRDGPDGVHCPMNSVVRPGHAFAPRPPPWHARHRSEGAFRA
jgi:LysR substrate binding domain